MLFRVKIATFLCISKVFGGGTHNGSRTSIVNALSLSITPNILMKWTVHSDYKAMKPYIDIVDFIKGEHNDED